MIPPYLYDAGALIALERGHRVAAGRHALAMEEGRIVLVPAVVVTQVWRDPKRQHLLGQILKSCEVIDVDNDLARAGGVLCASAKTRDAVDAVVVAAADRFGHCIVWTSDPQDLERLRSCTRDPKRMNIRTV